MNSLPWKSFWEKRNVNCRAFHMGEPILSRSQIGSYLYRLLLLLFSKWKIHSIFFCLLISFCKKSHFFMKYQNCMLYTLESQHTRKGVWNPLKAYLYANPVKISVRRNLKFNFRRASCACQLIYSQQVKMLSEFAGMYWIFIFNRIKMK